MKGGSTMQANIIISEDILDWVISRVSPGALSSKLWELLCAWKDGVKVPTYNQIEKISKASGIPLGYFFLKTPPVEDTSFVEYRTVDSAELSNPSRNLIDIMHDMEIIQDWLRNELSIIGDNNLQFVGAIDNHVNQKIFADYVRELLQIEINWYEQNHTAEENFRLLRNQISTIGVMVMMSGIVGSNTHRPLDTNEFRAFALVDEKAPLIFINSNDSINGKLFSLLHEFAHICLGENSLFNDRFGSATNVSSVETLCNALAAEILVPQSIFLTEWNVRSKTKDNEEVIEELAKWFKCGATVIARRAYDQAFIDYATYLKIAKKSVQFYLDHKNKKSGGGDYYRTAASRIDRRFFDLLIGSVHEGRTLYSDAFRLTNTNRSTFATLAEKMGGVI